MNLERDGNLIEAGVWFVLALILFIYSFRREKHLRSTFWMLVVTMVVFGFSDSVEARTGAWWEPWWLFAWKALCVVTLLLGVRRYRQLTKVGSLANNDAKS